MLLNLNWFPSLMAKFFRFSLEFVVIIESAKGEDVLHAEPILTEPIQFNLWKWNARRGFDATEETISCDWAFRMIIKNLKTWNLSFSIYTYNLRDIFNTLVPIAITLKIDPSIKELANLSDKLLVLLLNRSQFKEIHGQTSIQYWHQCWFIFARNPLFLLKLFK